MSARDRTLKALLIDLDGVLYEGERVIPGAQEAVAWLRHQAVPHLFLTNTTSRPRSALVDKLHGFGMDVVEGDILTPPVAAGVWMRSHHVRAAALFIPPATRAELSDLEAPDDEQADAVVVGDLGKAWTFELLNRAFRLLMTRPQRHLVALGMTRFWRAPDGLRLDTGPFVTALAHASGAEPVVVGKPALPFFRTALDRLNVSAAQAAMIGDDLNTDVGGAQAAGIPGILVRTGKFRGEDESGEVVPHAVLESIAELPRWWQEQA